MSTRLRRDVFSMASNEGLTPLFCEDRGKHWALVCREGRIFCPSTPSDHRSMKNVRAAMRRMARGVL